MNEPTLSACFAYLDALHGVEPREAQKRLRVLQAAHPDLRIRLVWQREPYDDSLHYDLIVHGPDGNTLSMSLCAEDAVPWPLRGVHRWSDADLLRVNSHVLTVQQAIGCLDFIWDEARVTDRLIDACVIDAELGANPVAIDDEELQAGVDAFRRARGLCSAGDTQRWLASRGMTHTQLERVVADNIAVSRLRNRVAGDRIDSYFAERRHDFDVVRVAQLELEDAAEASRVRGLIRAGRAELYRVPERSLRRRDLPDAARSILFETPLGQIVDPPGCGDRVAMRIVDRRPAALDEATRDFIESILFDEWLAQRRRTATIEWQWGSLSRTAR